MIYNLTENQSYDTQTLHDLLPDGYSVSGSGESKVTVHGEIIPAIQTIIDNHINAMTPNERALKNTKDDRIIDAKNEADKFMSVITNKYSASEIATWDIQESEARANIPDGYLSQLAIHSGIPIAELRSSVLSNADAYRSLSAEAVGRRKKMVLAINAASDISEVSAIVF